MNTYRLISQKLSNFDLSRSEVKIYLHLLESGCISVQTLADHTHINRTTVYRYLTSLQKKGLVEWVIDKRGKKIQAKSISGLKLYLTKTEARLKMLKQDYRDLVKLTTIYQPPPSQKTQVRYYYGRSGLQQQIWNTLKAEDTIVGYSAYGRADYAGTEFMRKFWKQQSAKKPRLTDYIITNDQPVVSDYLKRHQVSTKQMSQEVRYIPKNEFYINADITIYNNIYSIVQWSDKEIVGVEIENAEIAKTEKSIFWLLWKTAKPYNFK